MAEEPTNKGKIDPKQKTITQTAESDDNSSKSHPLHDTSWLDHDKGHHHAKLRDDLRLEQLKRFIGSLGGAYNKPDNED